MSGEKWPEHYPESCPPEDAQTPNEVFYRFVKDLGATDFKSNRVRFPTKEFTDLCVACGLSMYKDKDEIVEAQKRVVGMDKKKIAQVNLNPGPGLVLSTPSNLYPSHHTWWIREDTDGLKDYFLVLT